MPSERPVRVAASPFDWSVLTASASGGGGRSVCRGSLCRVLHCADLVDPEAANGASRFAFLITARAVSGANVQKRSRVADRSSVAMRARQPKPGLGERLVLAGAVSTRPPRLGVTRDQAAL